MKVASSILFFILLTSCSGRIGANVIYEYGDAVDRPSDLTITTQKQSIQTAQPQEVKRESTLSKEQQKLFAPGRAPF